MSTFVERLKELIGDGSVSAFAKRCHVPVSTIRSNLKGIEPGMGTLVSIAEGAGVDIEWLVTGRGNRFTREHSLGKLQGRLNAIVRLVEGLEDENAQKAFMDEMFARATEKKQLAELKRAVGDGTRRRKGQ